MKKFTKIILALICAAMLLPLIGCDSPQGEASTDSTQAVTIDGGISSQIVKPSPLNVSAVNLMADITPEDDIILTDINEKNAPSDFAVRLFASCFENSKNTLISPLSVMSALAMTSNGAKGKTLEEMQSVLGMDKEQLNSFMLSYTNSLPCGEKYKLSLANSIWFTDDERFTVNRDFLQTNANYYGADVYKAPFNDKTLEDINKWVEAKTDGMIKDVLDRIPPEAVMYLVNALAFDAEWDEVYKKNQVYTKEFTNYDETKTNVEFMSCTVSDYLKDGNSTGFIKYYSGKKYAFVGILPNEGVSIEQYVSSLTGEKISRLLASKQSGKSVYTLMPKFEAEYSCEMESILKQMGMVSAFDGGRADLSALGTSTDGNLFIGRVIHKTFISVAEKGTKAGAATIVEVRDECALETPINVEYVTLDRPFVYMLVDCENNIPFFIGSMLDMK